MIEFALRSRRVVTGQRVVPATVVVRDGLISDVVVEGDPDYPGPVEDLGELVLMPGLTDTHVHINEPGRSDWEGFETATQAAAAGGITTVVDMPLNCDPVTVTRDALHAKLEHTAGKLWVNCGFWGGVIPGSVEQLPALLEAGVLGVKSFLIDSGIEEFPPIGPDDIEAALAVLSKFGVPYLFHAELDNGCSTTSAAGPSYRKFLASRPGSWEVDAVELLIGLCRRLQGSGASGRVHIVHLSSADALGRIREARDAGLRLSVETCPHYLTLWAETIPDGKTVYKCCPPIRDNRNREALWEGIKNRDIDFIVSDHSPCTPRLKKVESGDLGAAWGGISSLQLSLPLIWTEARRRGIGLAEVARLMASAPAKFAGLGNDRGKIAPSYRADLLVFDPERQFRVDGERIKHRHKITPYTNRDLLGVIERTYLGGRLVYADGECRGGPRGKAILRPAQERVAAVGM